GRCLAGPAPATGRGTRTAAREVPGAGRALRPGRGHAPGGGPAARLARGNRLDPPVAGAGTARPPAGAARLDLVGRAAAAGPGRRGAAAVPDPLGESAARAATSFAAGRARGGDVPAGAAALAEGVLRAMLFAKLRVALAALLALAVLGLGAGGVAYRTLAAG